MNQALDYNDAKTISTEVMSPTDLEYCTDKSRLKKKGDFHVQSRF
jgi:hypothetical protein